MDVTEWMKRLENTFSTEGIIGARLLDIIDSEKAYESYVIKKFQGYHILMDSFFDFYIETLKKSNELFLKSEPTESDMDYRLISLLHITSFKNLRASENLFLKGYPLDGYALLRDLKDRAIFLAAIVNGLSSFSALYGYKDLKGTMSKEDFQEKVFQARLKEEKRILEYMVRKKSGLDENHLIELERWERMFNQQVHGSRFTFFVEGSEWLKGEKPISLAPSPKESSIAMYINRSNETCWMLLRTLPFLQLKYKNFGDEWAEKWKVLDASFRYTIEGLGSLGKKIADAIIALVDMKFSFTPELFYIKRD